MRELKLNVVCVSLQNPRVAHIVVADLVRSCVWFGIDPCPHDTYDVMVKPEFAPQLQAIVQAAVLQASKDDSSMALTSASIPSKLSDKDAAMLLQTALESGIGYWAKARNFVDNAEGYCTECEIRAFGEVTSKTNPWKKITLDDVRLGIVRILERKLERGQVENTYHLKACLGLHVGSEDADYDSDTADLIVQAALYNEIVYG